MNGSRTVKNVSPDTFISRNKLIVQGRRLKRLVKCCTDVYAIGRFAHCLFQALVTSCNKLRPITLTGVGRIHGNGMQMNASMTGGLTAMTSSLHSFNCEDNCETKSSSESSSIVRSCDDTRLRSLFHVLAFM